MDIRVRDDNTVEISGYVNAVERKSKPLRTRIGQFVERICKGAFKRSLERNGDVKLLENHDWNRALGGTADGNLKLIEDSIGLRAEAVISDKTAVEKARHGDYIGWSFGFKDRDVEQAEENGMLARVVKDLDLMEVSLLDKTRHPAYDGTLVTVREDEQQFYGEPMIDGVQIREEPKKDKIDYSKYEDIIKKMKGEE